jgi:hypothetical protein
MEEIIELYSSPCMIHVVQLRKLQQAGPIAWTRETKKQIMAERPVKGKL